MFYPGPPPPVMPPTVQGELFPAHKTALVQGRLEQAKGSLVGLEHVVEVRPVREGEPWYACRLCDCEFK